jgi:hypothetical protein
MKIFIWFMIYMINFLSKIVSQNIIKTNKTKIDLTIMDRIIGFDCRKMPYLVHIVSAWVLWSYPARVNIEQKFCLLQKALFLCTFAF